MKIKLNLEDILNEIKKINKEKSNLLVNLITKTDNNKYLKILKTRLDIHGIYNLSTNESIYDTFWEIGLDYECIKKRNLFCESIYEIFIEDIEFID